MYLFVYKKQTSHAKLPYLLSLQSFLLLMFVSKKQQAIFSKINVGNYKKW